MSNLLRQIPSVHKLLEDEKIKEAAKGRAISEITQVIRDFTDELRAQIITSESAPSYEEIIAQLIQLLRSSALQKFQTVINATGVLLHTNLGRAPLPHKAIERIVDLGQSYFNLEINLETGKRGSRYTNVARLFNLLNSANHLETDTVIVNNNAGAVLVTLKALAQNREVIVSRGQLVEIGGGFRVPEVIAASGCVIKEVGTTNRTRLTDYANAISDETKAILLVHPSNYSIVGFTETVSRKDIARLANERGLLLIEDIGSGAFSPFDEPRVPTALSSSHVVTYSGDKLLGGPQAGIISGRKDLIETIKKEPLLRALRIDKLSLLSLEAVLELYLNQEYDLLPLWHLANLSADSIKERAKNWLNNLGPGLSGEILPTFSTMGGGSLPGETISSWALVLKSNEITCDELAIRLRRSNPSVIGKIQQDRVWLDPRTVLQTQEDDLLIILRNGVIPCS